MRRSRELLFNADTQKLELLLTPLNRLGLTMEGSYLAEAIRIALADLKRVRIKKLQPYFYLSTGYGTVAGTTSIALGFYDCNDLLKELNRELRGFEYSFNDVVNIVRHELGHALPMLTSCIAATTSARSSTSRATTSSPTPRPTVISAAPTRGAGIT